MRLGVLDPGRHGPDHWRPVGAEVTMTEVHVTRAGLGASSGAVDTNPVTTEIVRHSLNSAANQMKTCARADRVPPRSSRGLHHRGPRAPPLRPRIGARRTAYRGRVSARTMPARSDFRPIGEDGWARPEGYPDGVEVKVLAGALGARSQTGRRTTMTRWMPGTHVPRILVHDYVEEVLVIEGEFAVARRARRGLRSDRGPKLRLPSCRRGPRTLPNRGRVLGYRVLLLRRPGVTWESRCVIIGAEIRGGESPP